MIPHYAVVNARLSHRLRLRVARRLSLRYRRREQQALRGTRGSVEHQGMIYTLCTRVWRYNLAEQAKCALKLYFWTGLVFRFLCVPLGAPTCVISTYKRLFCEGGGVLRCNDVFLFYF